MVDVESQFTFGNVKGATHKTAPALPLARAQKSTTSLWLKIRIMKTQERVTYEERKDSLGSSKSFKARNLMKSDSYKNSRIGRFYPDAFGGFLPGLWARGPE